MSLEHETFIENAERKALEGYVAALKNVRDTIEHTDSKVIGEVQRWIEDGEAKLQTWADLAGKPAAGEGSSGSSSANDDGEGDVTDAAAAAGTGGVEPGDAAKAAA